ncbi:hypothetical protein Glove_372g84 [Diversispora epigaea]|uniref:Protein kinase domain-containing protein n=1 Tax=Diversispora epigaea TaxID=1348612 RepID=A0A397H6I5_9GLOM|nr:hypothetical protein Glove_372g84 [Diversispora epigaea]
MCTKENFIEKFGTWSSGNTNIDEIIKESQINNPLYFLQWIPYDNFHDIKHIADSEYYTLHSAGLRNKMIEELLWDYCGAVVLKELKDYKYDILEIIKAIKNIIVYSGNITSIFGISKNPSTQNYIIVMDSHDDTVHSLLFDFFLKIAWHTMIMLLDYVIDGLHALHENNLVHCNLHSRNILIKDRKSLIASVDPGLFKLGNDLISNSDNKKNFVYGSIPYIPPEVLRGNEFTKEGDIYSFGGIMYEVATGNQPFSDQAHDTYLIIDICNGVRPKVPDIILNWIPKCYLDKMYQCWDDDPSKRPTTSELTNYLWSIFRELEANDKRKIMNKSHEQKLLRSLHKFHPQSCYISRHIYTLYELQDSLEDIKSGKCADPNLYTYDMNSKDSTKYIDLETNLKKKTNLIFLL